MTPRRNLFLSAVSSLLTRAHLPPASAMRRRRGAFYSHSPMTGDSGPADFRVPKAICADLTTTKRVQPEPAFTQLAGASVPASLGPASFEVAA